MIIYICIWRGDRTEGCRWLSEQSINPIPILSKVGLLLSITIPESTTLFCLVPRTGSGPRGFSQQKVVSSSSGMISHWVAWTKSQHVSRCLKFMPLGGAFTSKDLFGLSLLPIRLTLAALAQWA